MRCDVAGLSVADFEHQRAARDKRFERSPRDRLVIGLALDQASGGL